VDSVKLNFLSNLAGNAATAVILLVALPVYLHYLGPDAFGLVGVFITLTGIAALLDMGLTPALTREIARHTATTEGTSKIRTTVRTLEVAYFFIAIFLSIAAYFLLPFLARYWLKPSSLDIAIVERCLQLMAIQLSFQLPLSFYTGGFIGLQKHGLMNLLNAFIALVRATGAVTVLVYFQGDVVFFFTWQVIVTVIHLIVMAIVLWKNLPSGDAAFKLEALRSVWGYAAGMFGISAISILLTQLDKIILSRALSLEHFGYYMIAWYMASLLLRPVGPVFNAWLPRLTQLAMTDRKSELLSLYRQGTQLVNLLVMPAAIVLACYSHLALKLYTGNSELADVAATPLKLLALGSALNALMHMPYALTLAYGWTSFTFYQNVIASIIIAPLTYWLSNSYGITGGAVGWLVVNLGYVIFSSWIIHKKYLRSETRKWYADNITLYSKTYFNALKIIMRKKWHH
jgi:O-antigen/teichoic acid export membrane protein